MTYESEWDAITIRHTEHAEGILDRLKGLSRNAFSYNPWTHPKGQWMQYFLKKFIEKTLFFIHKTIIKNYDKDAYQLDDVRLQADKAMLIDFFKEWTEERIQKIISMVADIFFFMLREDARYRRLYIILRNKLILEGQIMALTMIEQDELEKWKGK